MKTKELLLEVKVELGIKSDYALAQALDIPRQRISDYMSGRLQPDTYALMQIAMKLKRDPIAVIAEVEAENAKTEKKKDFWRSFLRPVGILSLMLALAFSPFYGRGQADRAGGFSRRFRYA